MTSHDDVYVINVRPVVCLWPRTGKIFTAASPCELHPPVSIEVRVCLSAQHLRDLMGGCDVGLFPFHLCRPYSRPLVDAVPTLVISS